MITAEELKKKQKLMFQKVEEAIEEVMNEYRATPYLREKMKELYGKLDKEDIDIMNELIATVSARAVRKVLEVV